MTRLLLKFILLCSIQGFAQKIAITNVSHYDGQQSVVKNSIILINGRWIEKILPSGNRTPDGYEIIDGRGYFLFPGLIDCHTHIDNMGAAQRALYSGVTTVRTAGVDAYQDVSLAALSASGKISGPDVIAAGVYVTPNPGETILADPRLGDFITGVESEESLRKMVRINIDRGAKVIKTRGTERAGLPETDPRKQVYTEQQLRAVVDEASKSGIPVMVHAHGDEGANAAVKAGARSIEHGTFLSKETLELMKSKGTFLVPTFITLEDLTKPGGDYQGPTLELRGKFMMPAAEKVFKTAIELGVKIATGADSDYSDKSTSRISLECEHFVRMGMRPYQAIQSATTLSAELLGLEAKTGKIQPGFEADLILLPGNPLEEIRNLQDILMVISNGKIALQRIPFGK